MGKLARLAHQAHPGLSGAKETVRPPAKTDLGQPNQRPMLDALQRRVTSQMLFNRIRHNNKRAALPIHSTMPVQALPSAPYHNLAGGQFPRARKIMA